LALLASPTKGAPVRRLDEGKAAKDLVLYTGVCGMSF
jgi:hypothetical protein